MCGIVYKTELVGVGCSKREFGRGPGEGCGVGMMYA